MTKFDELVDIITRNKNKNKKNKDDVSDRAHQDQELEVAGSEGSKNPIITFGDSETDPDLLDQLHRSPKLKPNDGSNATSWDSTWN